MKIIRVKISFDFRAYDIAHGNGLSDIATDSIIVLNDANTPRQDIQCS